jgi:hypothetical protein
MIAIILFPRYLTQRIFTITTSKLRGICKLNRPEKNVFLQIIFSSWLHVELFCGKNCNFIFSELFFGKITIFGDQFSENDMID